MTITEPSRVTQSAAGPSDFLRRLEAAAVDVAQRRGALEDSLAVRDDLIVRGLELYGEQGSTGRGLLSTRQVARAAGLSQGHIGRILAET
jgi:hypothetical protein